MSLHLRSGKGFADVFHIHYLICSSQHSWELNGVVTIICMLYG